MLVKSIIIFVILGTVCSEPIRRSTTLQNDILTAVLGDYAQQLESSMRPSTVRSIKHLMKRAVDFKLPATEIAMKAVHWLTSNVIGVAIGGIIALGVCKIIGKCSLGFDNIFSKFYTMLSFEQLEMAQNLLDNAVSRFEGEDIDEEEEEEGEEEEKIDDEAEDGKGEKA